MTTEETPTSNPYVGPRTFSYEDRLLFFGREREARDLLARVLSERLLLFYAQSGAGKSSLLYTRLIPQLQEEKGFVVLPVGRVGGELPAGVEQVDDIYVFNLALSIAEGADPSALAHLSLTDFLARLVRRTIVDASGQARKAWIYEAELAPAAAPAETTARRYALVIDQFEEIVTAHPGRWREREEFFRQLESAMQADPNLWVVLTLREEYVAALDPYAPLLADRLRARFYMERMGLEAALEAIQRPAEAGGRPFAPGIAEALRKDLCQVRVPGREGTVTGQYVEPVQLQVVCYQLWENIREHPPGSITADDLREAGDVDRALIKFYEDTLRAVLAEEEVQVAAVSERQVRTWFGKELITQEGTRDLVRQGEGFTGSLPNAVVDQLQNRFLVRSETRSGDTRIELVHDRFVEPILESNRAWSARNLNPLMQAAQAWREANRDPAALYTGSQLAAAANQLQANPEQFGKLEQEFIEEGQRAEVRRAARRQRSIAWGAALLALVFLALASWALWSRSQAQTAAQAAATAEAEAEAQALVAQDARDAAIFAQGRERNARSQAEANAATAVAAKAAAEAAITQAVASAATADAERATAQAANTAQVHALNDLAANIQVNLTVQAQAVALQQASPEPTATSRATPTGTPTLSAVTPGTSAPTPRPTPTATRMPASTWTPRPTPNLLVIAQQTQLAHVRATQTALAVAAPNGRIVFVSNRGSPYDLYGIDPKDPKSGWRDRLTYDLAAEPSYGGGTRDLVFVKLRTSATPETVYVMPITGGVERPVTRSDDYWQPSVAPNGQQIAVVSSRGNVNGEIFLIDFNGNIIKQITNRNPAKTEAPAWSPDGRQIVYASEREAGSRLHDIWLQDLSTGRERLLVGGPGSSTDPEWSPDGKRIAFISNRDGNDDVWVMDANGRNQQNLTHSPEVERYPAWSLDGNWLAFTRSTPDQEIFLMRADGTQVRNLTQLPFFEDFQPVWVPQIRERA